MYLYHYINDHKRTRVHVWSSPQQDRSEKPTHGRNPEHLCGLSPWLKPDSSWQPITNKYINLWISNKNKSEIHSKCRELWNTSYAVYRGPGDTVWVSLPWTQRFCRTRPRHRSLRRNHQSAAHSHRSQGASSDRILGDLSFVPMP